MINKFKYDEIKKIISFALFILIASFLFLRLTYLFRNVNWARSHLEGLKSAEPVDVVFVGASSTYVFWEPPRAWKEYGITSYDYAVDSAPAETLQGMVREANDIASPELIVIDARPFVGWSAEDTNAVGIRNHIDSVDYSLDRLLSVKESLSYRNFDDSNTSFYFDIAKYHSNLGNLASEGAWNLINNDGTSKYYGWEFIQSHEELTNPDYLSTESTAIAEGSEEILTKLLSYCKDNELNVLFVASPYYIDKTMEEQFNYISDVIESYGYSFLNTNNFAEEMNLDYQKDFYNTYHMNVYGAEKYTRFVANYLLENYQLNDHRNDDNKDIWQQMYEDFVEEDATTKIFIENNIKEKKEAYETGKSLKKILNIYEWLSLIQNNNYTVLMIANNTTWADAPEKSRVDSQFSIDLSQENSVSAIRIMSGTETLYGVDSTQETDYEASFSGHSDYLETYKMNCGSSAKIVIEDEAVIEPTQGEVDIVIYDNNYREVLDKVCLQQNVETGGIEIIRN